MPTLRYGLAALALSLPALAQASSDSSCAPAWKLDPRYYSSCSQQAALLPGNDTRSNLYWLLADQRSSPPPLPPLAAGSLDQGYGEVPYDLARLLGQPLWESVPTDGEGNRLADPLDQQLQQRISALGLGGEFNQRFATSAWAVGEGSRCQTNTRQTTLTFLQQLQDGRLLADEQRELARRRLQLLAADCVQDAEAAQRLQSDLMVQTREGAAFAAYLQGSAAFYAGNFEAAAQFFGRAAEAEQPWLQETAQYMQARTSLNAAQERMFDDWGFADPSQADAAQLQQAGEALAAYLRAWPDGRYAASARGLQRRLYWLQGNGSQLAASYQTALQQPLDAAQIALLLQEVDNKLLLSEQAIDIDQPLLLAVRDLTRMREYADQPLTLQQLQAQRPLFAGQEALHDYLLASQQLVVQKDAAAALRLLPAEDGPISSYLAFSRALLRGLALQQLGREAEALQHWQALIQQVSLPLQREQAELALALAMERAGQIDQALASDSPLRSQALRDRLLLHVAGSALLRQRVEQGAASEVPLALYALLYRDLMHGDYQGFLADQPRLADHDKQVLAAARMGDDQYRDASALKMFQWGGQSGDNWHCPALGEVARQLAANPRDAGGLLCLGEFVRTQALDDSALRRQPDAGELGSGQPQYRGKPFSRLDGYLQVMKDGKASHEQQAYALYRAIRCYAPSGYNQCGEQEIAESQRKRWFQTLKKQYAATRWARQLRYYW